jgi:hypothetical protein
MALKPETEKPHATQGTRLYKLDVAHSINHKTEMGS